MSGIDSIVLQLASTDLDAAGASSERDDGMIKAQDLTRDASVRRQLPHVSAIAVKECDSFDSYERVLNILVTALLRETSSGDSRDPETVQSLANQVCFLICASGGHYTLLLRSAEAQLICVKNDYASEAFENVAPENQKAGDSLATATSRTRRKSTIEEQDALAKNRARRKTAPISTATYGEGLSTEEQDVLAKNRARRKTAPISAAGGPDQSMTQEEKDEAAKNRARRSTKVIMDSLTPDVVREPSSHDRGSRREIMSSASTSTSDSDAMAKERARPRRPVPPDDVVKEPSQHDRGSRRVMTTADADAMAKNRARRKLSPDVVREPSSHDRGSSSKKLASTGSGRLDSDAVAKNRARRSTSGLSRDALTETVESDSKAKQRAHGTASTSELAQEESDVVTKSRARRSGRGGSNPLHHIESDGVGKSRSRASREKKQGARMGLNELEGEVQACAQDGSEKKNRSSLPPSLTPGVVFERDDGEVIERGEFDDNEWEYEKAEHALPHINESLEKGPAAMNMGLLSSDHDPHKQFEQLFGGGGGAGDTPVAVLVCGNDEEEGALIPSIHAVECDPDDKPKILQSRRFRLYGFLALLFMALIVTLITKFLTSDSDSGYAPTPSPTSVGDVDILKRLQIVVGEDMLADESTPEAKAAYWITNEDPMQLAADSPNLIQRYVLAVFYISTTQESEWLSCNRPQVGQESECYFKILSATFPFMVYEEVPWYRWLSEEHECDWAGLFCDETEHVRGVELHGQEISGTLPAVLKGLTYLQSLSLMWNNFHGTLPKEWAELQHLLNVDVQRNWLEGEVPVEWWQNSQWAINRLNIGSNQFSGTVPTEIGGLNSLRALFAYENQITGTIPTEFGAMELLTFTRLSRNFFGGTLPTEIGQLSTLKEMWLHRNDLEGTIPTELGQLTALEDLRLHYNPLNGTIPLELYDLQKLGRLDVYNCDLTGTIPTDISRMKSMQFFRIRDNNFQGTIPTEIGLWRNLKELWFHRNNFIGSIPTEVCSIRTSPQELGLYMIDADCLETATDEGEFGDPAVFCAKGCCTRCCDGNTGICDS